MMIISKVQGETFTNKPYRPILGFVDEEKMGGIFNDIFPLVITTTMVNCDVSRVLIDGRSFERYHVC